MEKAIAKATKSALKRIEKRTITSARKWSSGSFSLEQIRDLFDHAYATRHGTPKLPPDIINVHEGNVRDGWYTERRGDEIVLLNESDIYNDYLFDGTFFMFERGGIELRVKDEIELVADSILEDEIMKELNR